MKIAVWHNLPSGGGKRALYYHVRGLVERGHEVSCWCLETADQSYLPLGEFAPERVIPHHFNQKATRHFLGKGSNYYDAIERMKAFDEACRACAVEIDAGSFDVLFANSSLHYHMPYIARHVKLRTVLYLQEPCRFLYEAAPILPWVSDAPSDLTEAQSIRGWEFVTQYPKLQTLRVQAKQEWLSAQACHTILVNSYFSRESILRAYGVNSQVCYLGVDTSLFRNYDLDRERFILGLGSFDSIKGIDLAVKAVALLSTPRPPLVWISNSGNPHYRSEILALAGSLDVDLRIEDSISDERLVTLLNQASLLLYTSKLEPFGFAPLEANACGLPVVAVAVGGVRETIRNGLNGFLVEPDPLSIAHATERLIQDPDLATRMGKHAVSYVHEMWSVERSVASLEYFLTRAVDMPAAV